MVGWSITHAGKGGQREDAAPTPQWLKEQSAFEFVLQSVGVFPTDLDTRLMDMTQNDRDFWEDLRVIAKDTRELQAGPVGAMEIATLPIPS